MLLIIKRKFLQEIAVLQSGILPGIAAITFVVVLRLIGSLQFLEWAAFDKFLWLRPAETVDDRIVIVGINEKDIRSKNYPIPDRDIATLLRKLKSYQPAVIGLDIFRDLPVEPGHKEFIQALKETKNLVVVEKVLPDPSGAIVNPQPNLPQEQLGFSDAVIDADGYLRRSLLATSNLQEKWRLSLSLKLAEAYLATKGISLENVDGDPYGMKFKSTEFPRVQPNYGGYVKADVGGTQILINFRSGRKPFHMVSLLDIQSGKVKQEQIRGKIVLIGMTSPSAKDYVNSAAIKSENPALIYGVEVQAHVISQIVSAVLDGRSHVHVWTDAWEYLWIIVWGILGMSLGRIIRSPLKVFVVITIVSIYLFGLSYGLLLLGWWIPFVPALMILVFNSVVLAAFYRYDEAMRSRIQDRQLVIDQTFDAIHSQPLQTLGIILRKVQSNSELTPQQFLSELQQLNQELRGIYDLVRKEAACEVSSLYLREQKLDLAQALHEILNEVCHDVLERDYPYFKSIKVKVFKFEPMNERLSLEQKRSLCRFLEEALCNVGKYAVGTTRLDVTCCQQGNNIIRVADNGLGMDEKTVHQGFGTKQARSLAKQLGGKFERFSNSPKGVVCQLTW